MRAFLKFLSSFMMLVLIFGAAQVSLGLVNFYLVYSGHAVPGEPVYVDERAFSLADSATLSLLGVVLIALSVSVRALLLRKLAAPPHDTSFNPDSPERAG